MPVPRRIICTCLDVSEEDVIEAIKTGYRDLESLKRFTAVTMGPCQGKLCLLHLIAVCARETGRQPHEVGLTTTRPPSRPVPLGLLAAGSHEE